MTANTWPLPWRIAAALARDSGLDWARWAYGTGRQCKRIECERGAQWCPGEADNEPVPDPSDAEAYRADCSRRGVEPGPMPALAWTGPDVSWRVRARIEGDADAVALDLYPGDVVQIDMSTADLARLSALATAVEEVTCAR